MDIGSRIKELREIKKITQEQLAFEINVSRQTISKWESGMVTPDSNNINLLCDYFDVSADYLLSGKTDEIITTIRKEKNRRLIITDIVILSIGILGLIVGLIFSFVDGLNDKVTIRGSSSFMIVSTGTLIIIISSVVIVISSLLLIKDIRKKPM